MRVFLIFPKILLIVFRDPSFVLILFLFLRLRLEASLLLPTVSPKAFYYLPGRLSILSCPLMKYHLSFLKILWILFRGPVFLFFIFVFDLQRRTDSLKESKFLPWALYFLPECFTNNLKPEKGFLFLAWKGLWVFSLVAFFILVLHQCIFYGKTRLH